MILVYSFIKRPNQSRSIHKTWRLKDITRALEKAGMEIVRDSIVCYASKEVPDDQAIAERKLIESEFRMISRHFGYHFEGAF